MERKNKEKLHQLFMQFAQETQASSFAVDSLYNQTINIIETGERDGQRIDKNE